MEKVQSERPGNKKLLDLRPQKFSINSAKCPGGTDWKPGVCIYVRVSGEGRPSHRAATIQTSHC